MPELILLLLALGLIVAPVVIVVAILAAKRSRQPPAPPQIPGVEMRLAEIESLRARNAITDEEYQEKRKQIIANL